MRVGVDGVHNVRVSVVARGHIRHCRSTFSVGAQWHVTDVPNTKDEMHVVGPLAPEFKLIHTFPPLLCMHSWFWSGCSRSSRSIYG